MSMPKLRFASFESDSWNNYRLGNICSFEQGIQVDVELQSFESDENKVRFLRIENYTQNSFDFRYIPKDIAGKKSITKDELAVVRYGATAGYIGRGFDGVLANNLFKLIPDNETLDLSFFYHIMKSDNTFRFFQSEMSGGAMPALSFGIVKALKLSIPSSKVEQNKIAGFLSSVDKKISLLIKNHALLAQYKKGVMQKLFKQEIRFKDDNGNTFPDWEIKPLSKLAEKNSLKNKDNAVNAVLTNSAKSGIVNQGDYFNKDIANQGNLTGYTVVEKNDFIYNPRISELAPVGPIKRNHIGQGVMSPLYTTFRFKDENVLDYLEQYFNTTMWHRYMNSIANFGARHDRMNITSADFYALPIPLPCEDEREKIVSFIKALETKVNAVNEQIELTKTFKKGLLQQMFV